MSPKKEVFVPGVVLRSSTVAQAPPDLPESVTSLFSTYGIGTLPSMPTELVCEKFDEVQSLLLEVLEARKQLEQLGSTFSPADAASNTSGFATSNSHDRAFEVMPAVDFSSSASARGRFPKESPLARRRGRVISQA